MNEISAQIIKDIKWKDNEFRGVMSIPSFLEHAIKGAFNSLGTKEEEKFNVCSLHRLPTFKHDTFAYWVASYHCKVIPTPEIGWMLRQYVVNYFLCPDCKCELELEALTRQVFPDYVNHIPTLKPIPELNPSTQTVRVRWRVGKFIIGTRAE